MKSLLGTGLFLLAAAAVSAAEYSVRDCGAVGDGVTKDTAAIQQAIDKAAENGGGTVFFPPGVYVTGSIFLKSNIDFYVGPGAVIFASPDKEDYNPLDVCEQNYACPAESSFGAHLILCIEQKNVTVRGPGKIDGNSPAFLFDSEGKPYPHQAKVPWRPSQMLYFVESENIRITDIELARSPYWSLFLYGCEQVSVRGAKISTERKPFESDDYRTGNLPGLTYNGDGIDIDCSRFVTVSDCRISTSDDCLTLRGSVQGIKNKKPCEWITVTNCTLSTPCNAVRIGVGQGEIHHAVLSNLAIHNTRTAFNFVSNWSSTNPRGVDISDISVQNVTLDCRQFLHVRYGFGELTKIKNITFSDISGSVEVGGYLRGKKDHPIENITLRNLNLHQTGNAEFLSAVDVAGLSLDGIRVSGNEKPVFRSGSIQMNEPLRGNLESAPMTEEEYEQYRNKGGD